MSKLLFGHFYKVNPWFGVYYLLQFILALSAANFYSDSDRFLNCGIDGWNTPATATTAFDTALKLLAVYHIIEWLRTTILLMISCTGANLTLVYYVTGLNFIYGLVAYIFCYAVYFSPQGKACANS